MDGDMTIQNRNPRILCATEATFLSSGFSTYGREIMKRLHASGKYELAELAIYGTADDHRRHELPWRYFPNMPAEDSPRRAEYDTRSSYEFGEFTFNDVCLEFRPDIVFDFRDPWMFEFEVRSPFRPFYHLCLMPTVDAIPQHESWLSTFMSADAVLAYTDWGLDVLEQGGGGLIRTRGTAPPAADTETFAPMDREALRRQMHVREDVDIVGTVMRNMPRKLYPQLIRDFARFLKAAPPETARKTYLYLHTSYPERDGWDIPRLIKESGIASRILVTYKCKLCQAVFPAVFQDARGACFKCGSASAVLPNVAAGVDRLSLAKIINLFDVYVQYSANEGYGMPMVEAAACGVPVMAVDYSAMSDVVHKLHGIPIPVASLDEEPYSGRLLARPHGEEFVRLLAHFLSKPPSVRQKAAQDARRAAETACSWDRSAAAWMEVFDSLPPREPGETWLSPIRIHSPKPAPAEMPSNEAYVEWAITNVLGRPDLVNSYMAVRMVRDLNWGMTHQVPGTPYYSEESFSGGRPRARPFTTGHAYAELKAMCEYNNHWEERRESLNGSPLS